VYCVGQPGHQPVEDAELPPSGEVVDLLGAPDEVVVQRVVGVSGPPHQAFRCSHAYYTIHPYPFKGMGFWRSSSNFDSIG
jgi:hypothetical protein